VIDYELPSVYSFHHRPPIAAYLSKSAPHYGNSHRRNRSRSGAPAPTTASTTAGSHLFLEARDSYPARAHLTKSSWPAVDLNK